MTTPILFIIFNKREETKKVFAVIREQRPKQLFIAADGPRHEKEGEAEKSQYVRQWVLDQIDWECDVKTRFLDQNVGCGRGPSEAISWFFEHVEEGIILEDDCLPNESFFQFCADLLDRYRANTAISMISGNNFQQVQPMPIDADYYFSVFPSSNGWATWRRSWEGFNFHLSSWPTVNKRTLANYLFQDRNYSNWWISFFNDFYNDPRDDCWDYQYHFQCMIRQQLAVIPKANLIQNIGYGPDATHSQDPNSYFANVPTHKLTFPLTHPVKLQRNFEADLFIQSSLFGRVEAVSNFKRLKKMIKTLISYKQVSENK